MQVRPRLRCSLLALSLSPLAACTNGGESREPVGATAAGIEPTPKETEPEPPPPPRLRRLEVHDDGGCVSDNDERVLCWGTDRLPFDSSPASVAALREATPVDFGQGDAKLVDLRVQRGRVCALFDDHQLRCRSQRVGAKPATSTAVGEDPRRVGIGESYLDTTPPDCVLTSERLQCQPSLDASVDQVIDFDMNGHHGCAASKDGTIFCWPDDEPLARAKKYEKSFAGQPAQLELGRRLCVRNEAGELWCGESRFPPSGAPMQAMAHEPIVDFDIGEHHYCVLTSKGVVECVGDNGYAQLGAGDSDPHSGSVAVPLPGPAREVATANSQSCALVDDGIWCWGTDSIGYGPSPIDHHSFDLEAEDLVLVDDFSCARRTDGQLVCWGTEIQLHNNEHGGIVAASRPSAVEEAIRVEQYAPFIAFGGGELVGGSVLQYLDPTPASVDWRKNNIERIAYNDIELCVIHRSGGKLECLREDYESEKFVRVREIPPIANASALDNAISELCAVVRGHVRCIIVPDDDEGTGRWSTIEDLGDAVDVVITDDITCALRSTGGVRCWDSSFDDDVYAVAEPGAFELDVQDVVELIGDDFGVCARTRAGAVACGRPNAEQRSLNVEIERGAVEIAGGQEHWCARIDADASGTSERIECRGKNQQSQLGKLGPNVMLKPTAITIAGHADE